MSIITIVGITLAVLGAVGLIYGGINYASGRNVVSMGDMHLEVAQKEELPLVPLAGALALTAGVVLTVVGQSRSKRGEILEV